MLKSHFEILGDHLRASSFNMMALDEMNEFSIFEQSDTRR